MLRMRYSTEGNQTKIQQSKFEKFNLRYDVIYDELLARLVKECILSRFFMPNPIPILSPIWGWDASHPFLSPSIPKKGMHP